MLLTGGAGFIGCEVACRLLDGGHEVSAVDNLHGQVHGQGRPARLPAGVSLLTGDVAAPQTWETVLRLVRPDVIVHLAAETGTGQSLDEATRHGMTNVVGTTAMLDALTRCGHLPERIVLPSSRAVYGEGEWLDDQGLTHRGIRRTHQQLAAGQWNPLGPLGQQLTFLPHQADRTGCAPASIYAATKLAQEHVLASWCGAKGVDLGVLRLQNVYGPGQALGNPYTGILALFSRLACEGRSIDVYEDGAILRDFVHVSDVAEALLGAVVSSHPVDGAVVDIGGGAPTTLLEVARMIARRFDAPEPAVSGRFRDGDVRAAYADLGAAASVLGYKPSIVLADGLADLCEWVGQGAG